MRRSRIKVQATVPVRRKALQETANTDTNKLPSTPDVEKTTSEEDLKIKKVENTLESRTESEKPTESVVSDEEKPINNLPAPKISSENKTQNRIQKNREVHNSIVDKQSSSIEANEEPDTSVSNEESSNVETIKKVNNIKTEPNVEINKKVEIVKGSEGADYSIEKQFEKETSSPQFEGNKDDNLNVKKQIEKEVLETPSLHVEANPPKHIPNRSCFMRPVPRLDSGGRIRKNSVQGSGASASESEDDSKKSSVPTRVRNDSICSVQSNKDSSSNAHGVSKLKLGQQKRRLTVSESARKLAEARREFMLKHENKTPDRNKLTMYDLIYYNPVSNPMTKTDNPTPPPRKISVCSIVPDDSKEEEEEEDEPIAMPVPRVKVGPDGQLIVDEKSLIIERTEKEKNRSGPIVHDENNGGGFYKRRQKSKDWSKWDTLRFYKALSNIGTDFLLMQRFFPKRTRQELKLKFKKEERTNRKLVEQALKCQVFDMETLQEEMAVFAENERKETETMKTKAEAAKKQHKSKRASKCRFVIGSIEEIGNSCEEDVDNDLSSGESRDEGSQKKLKKSSKRKCKTPISPITIHDQESESSSDTEDTEIYNVKPTRSGRLPKRRKLQAPNVGSSDDSEDSEEEESLALDSKSTETENRVDSQPQDIIANIIPNARDIEPGSLVILTRESPGEPGKTVVQVYMVSKNYNANDPNSEQNMTPVNLSPELLATVNSKISEAEPVRVKPEVNSKD